jgi:polar amino acid transport system substrate-binding protein
MKLRLRGLATCGVVVLVAAAAAACSSGDADSSSTPSASVAKVGSIPSAELTANGTLTACTNYPFQPMQYQNSDGGLEGVDIELLKGAAARLGLEFNAVNTDFTSEISSLQSGKCDLIAAQQYVTAERLAQVDMMQYWKTTEAIVVPSGNPAKIEGYDKLCGFSTAAATGTLEAKLLKAASDTCVADGKKPIDIQLYANQPTAMQALLTGHAQSWMASLLTATVANQQHNAKLETLTPFSPASGGGIVSMSFDKKRPGVSQEVLKALQSMYADGSYQKIFAKYEVSSILAEPVMVTSAG